jgi:predicted nucleotidyltransferase
VKFPTKYDKVNKLLLEVKQYLLDSLNENILGIYLFGSLTYDAYKEGLSDIDIMVVTRHLITNTQIGTLNNTSDKIFHLPLATDLDISFVVKTNLCFDGRSKQTGLEIWKGKIVKSENSLGSDPIIWFNILTTKVILYGPDPLKFVTNVPLSSLTNALKNDMKKLQSDLSKHFDDKKYLYYYVATLCRIVYTFNKMKIVSKKEALNYYLEKYPDTKYINLINSAFEYENGNSDSFDNYDKILFKRFFDEVSKNTVNNLSV